MSTALEVVEEINNLLALRRSNNAVTQKSLSRVFRLANAQARVGGRLGGKQKPSDSDVRLDIAKSLRALVGLMKELVRGGTGVSRLRLPFVLTVL